jgi:multidrug efflux system membrane fusion protein
VIHSRPILAFVLGVALPGLAACSGARSAQDPRPQHPALAVRTAPVAVQDVIYKIKALGSLEAQDQVQVTAEVEGAVSEVRFHEGDRVTPQTILLLIDPERYRLELDRTQATLQQAVADAERAEADLRRREELAGAELVAAEELARSRQETARLKATAEAARVARAIAQQNVRRSEVRAPMAGIINTRTVDTGQFVKTGDVLATLVDTRRLRLRFKVTDAESLYARVGSEVSFRVSALGPHDYPARIYHVGQVADPTTRQVEVLAWVQNPGELKPGFFAEVRLAGESRKDALVVPEGAVLASEQGFVTYVVEKQVAHQRPVQIGLRTGDGLVEILSGLKPREEVVVEGSDRLEDGTPVRAAEAATQKKEETPAE